MFEISQSRIDALKRRGITLPKVVVKSWESKQHGKFKKESSKFEKRIKLLIRTGRLDMVKYYLEVAKVIGFEINSKGLAMDFEVAMKGAKQ